MSFQMISAVLKNPLVMAALIGVGTYVVVDQMMPDFVESIPFVSAFSLGLIAAVAYLVLSGRVAEVPVVGPIVAPLVNKVAGPSPVMPSIAAVEPMRARQMAATMNDLFNADQF